MDPHIPLYDVMTLTGQINQSLIQDRLLTWLTTSFGLLATLLVVLGLLVAQLHQVQDAAARDVAQVVEGATARTLDRVEQDALTQRVLGHLELVDGEGLEHALEDEGAGEDDVGTVGVHAGDARPLLDARGAGEGLGHGPDLVARDAEAVERAGSLGARRRLCDRGDRLDGPRRTDRHLEAVGRDLPRVGREGRADVRATRRHRARESPQP